MRICDGAETAETKRRSMTLQALSARVLTALFAGWNMSLVSQGTLRIPKPKPQP